MFWGDIKEKTMIEAAQLCCWTWCFGIKVLSIYEAEDINLNPGNLKQNANSLQSHINNISRQFFIHEKIVPKIRVTALDTSINYAHFENKDLNKSGKFKSDDLDIAELDRRLIPKFSEPQLIIFFSPNIDIDGFPPWHIHLTELFHVPENYNFDYSIFLQGLRKYSKCDQRFGR
ncbi:665_t:CDS:2 [Diversispora eburnea]|uniref:ditrans,polycis-polyprenyl diphosphate synthase [(2E,6E)-farnesyldiphosphate specific] n=1 Tax=Diversispora eburnea TaxID=1213867 RepID=A0A9N8VZ55_9GLOM|nr:665_t:CDS:2 [Diversispora eburnea]